MECAYGMLDLLSIDQLTDITAIGSRSFVHSRAASYYLEDMAIWHVLRFYNWQSVLVLLCLVALRPITQKT